MSRALLLDERVIALQPALIRALEGDVLGAILLQQLAYWMPYAQSKHDGKKWVYKTYDHMSEETALSPDQCRRTMRRLEKLGAVVSCQPGGNERVKWYRLNLGHALFAHPDEAAPVDEAMTRDLEAAANDDAALQTVFDEWVAAVGKNPNATKFTKERKAAIRARLREGYTTNDLVCAVRGIGQSRWHMGDNPEHKTYNDLTLALRNGSKVETFRDLYVDGGDRPKDGVSNANVDAVKAVIEGYRDAGAAPGELFGVRDDG